MSATVDTNAQPLMVLHQSITGQAVQLMAPFMPPSSDRPAYQSQSPKLSSIIAVNAGSASLSPGTSTVLDRYIHRSILGCGGPRTALRPVRARLTGGTASTSSDCLRVSLGGVRTQQLSKAQAELQRRRTDPSSPRQEILFKIHGEAAVPDLDFVDIAAKCLAQQPGILLRYLQAQPAPMYALMLAKHPASGPTVTQICVLVVVSALEDQLSESLSFRTILPQLQQQIRNGASLYLVLNMVDKVVPEDVPAKVLDRLLVGLGIKPAHGDPCLDSFAGIFATIAGHPSKSSGPELAAYESSKLSSIVAAAQQDPEYAAHLPALQSRLGTKALWRAIVDVLDVQSLQWLAAEQVPRLQRRLEDVVEEQSALPEECPSIQAVLDAVQGKVDQEAMLSHIVSGTVLVPLSGWVDENEDEDDDDADDYDYELFQLAAVLTGYVKSKKWASYSRDVRQRLQSHCNATEVATMAEGAVRVAMTWASLSATEGAASQPDRLSTQRFSGLLSQLTGKVLANVIQEELSGDGSYIDQVLQSIVASGWHLQDGPPQVCKKLDHAMEDLAREMAVAVLPKVLRQAALLHAVPDFQLKEDEAAARQRTALCQRADSLFKAIHQAQELQTKAAAGPEDVPASAPKADATPAAEPQNTAAALPAVTPPSSTDAGPTADGAAPDSTPDTHSSVQQSDAAAADGTAADSSSVPQAGATADGEAAAASPDLDAATTADAAAPAVPADARTAAQQPPGGQSAAPEGTEDGGASEAASSGPSEEPDWFVLDNA